MRINKFIASYSSFSRRKADELILTGRVQVNNKQVKTLGIDIDQEKDTVKIDNKTITPNEKKIYLALHKPARYLTTRQDEFGRKTIMELLPDIENLKPVGRLDYETEGLLLISNDGEFINTHTHPRYECEKEYLATLEGPLTAQEKQKLESGIMIEDKKTYPAKIVILSQSNDETFLRITIHEGRNRQIRKMFDSLNRHVKYLKRIRIGEINLGDLKKGAYRPLTTREINANKPN
ncbi:MAG: pseudouridine synthase [Candidatus Gracilibacteria bacterium]|jgi:pseudouridine synthase